MNKIMCIVSFILVFVVTACNENKSTNNNADSDVKSDTMNVKKPKTIIFFGNSLTAGYGIDPSKAFPALIQKRIDSLNFNYKVINAGVSGETTSGGNGRVDWILKQPVDIFVLELGANDGLRGIPITETKNNLQSIIDKVKAANPNVKIVLAGMQIPPNMGQQYTSDFRAVFPELAEKNNIALIPFILEGVGGEAKLNQEDGIHPTEEGHKLITENIWNVIRDVL